MNEEAPVVEETFDDLVQVEVTSNVKKFPDHGAVLDSVIGSGKVYESCSGYECPAQERPGRKPAGYLVRLESISGKRRWSYSLS